MDAPNSGILDSPQKEQKGCKEMYSLSTGIVPWLMVLLFLVAFMALNELARRSKVLSIVFFIVTPIILTFTVWIPKSSASGTLSWFTFAKVYSALLGSIGFMAIRYIKKIEHSKFAVIFPPLILSINILEAVMRDFQNFSNVESLVDGIYYVGGVWNIMNGVAGIINIITITGMIGICVSKKKSEDMLWPDMCWFWIIAYDLWNFAFTYNNFVVSNPYSGIALLLSCTIPTLLWAKGAWLQHRAYTLSFYTMFLVTFPEFFMWDALYIAPAMNHTAYFLISLISLLFNIGVLVYEIIVVAKTKRNPLTQEIYVDLNCYKEVKELAR